MFHPPTAIRVSALAVIGTVTALTVTGCVGGQAPVATPSATPTPTPTGLGAEAPESIETDVPVHPADPLAPGFTTLVDDYRVLTVQVPTEWGDVSGEPFTGENDQEWASIVAAPDIDDYRTSWDTPGVELAATPTAGRVDEAAAVQFLQGWSASLADGCTPESTEKPYDDGFYSGVYSTFVECAGGETYGFAIIVQNATASHAIALRGQLLSQSDENQETLDVLLSTFESSL